MDQQPEIKKSNSKKVTNLGAKVICIYEIKMCIDFQSAGTTFGVELPVANTKEAVNMGFKRADTICESMMEGKLKEVQQVVAHLSKTKDRIESGEYDPLKPEDEKDKEADL